MRSQLQLHCRRFRRHCDSSQSRKIQRVRREIRFGSCVGDGSGQICFRHGQAFRNLGSRKMERPRGKCAMLWPLDRATQLTDLKSETSYSEPPTCERQLWTRSPWRRCSCSLTGEPRNERLPPLNHIAQIGGRHERVKSPINCRKWTRTGNGRRIRPGRTNR
jgi:hypothetical protein